MKKLQAKLKQFRDDRDWLQYHTPKNLAMAICGECGELAALFQWAESEKQVDTDRIAEELADILIYAINMCNVMDFDVEDIIDKKIALNRIKYPAKE